MRYRPLLGAILAGGAGRRMGGRDKGLQTVHERPLIDHVIQALRPQVDDVLIVANRNLDFYARRATVVSDPDHEAAGCRFAGPLAGIVAALTQAGQRDLLTLPVDCPAPPACLAERLTRALSSATVCAFAHDGQRAQPLFAVYAPAVLESARQALSADMPVWSWQQSLAAVAVDFADCAAGFDNLNSRRDIERFEKDDSTE